MPTFLNSARQFVDDHFLTPTRVKQVKTILRGARKLIATKGWVQKSEAVNKYRKPVDAESPNAVRFCAYGALLNKTKTTKASAEALELAERVLGASINPFIMLNEGGFEDVFTFNDNPSTTKEDVLSKLDEAIASFDTDTKALARPANPSFVPSLD